MTTIDFFKVTYHCSKSMSAKLLKCNLFTAMIYLSFALSASFDNSLKYCNLFMNFYAFLKTFNSTEKQLGIHKYRHSNL